jgi:hypothetical protein
MHVTPDPDKSSPDPLDDWLAAARWPETPAESTQRLRGHWNRLTRPRVLNWHWLAPLSAAAVVALAIGLAWLTQRKPPLAVSPHTVSVQSKPVALSPALLTGRPPTVLETMMIQAAMEREKKAKTRSKSAATVAAAPVPNVSLPKPVRAFPPVSAPPAVPPQLPVRPPPRPDDRPGWIVALLKQSDDAAVRRYLDLVGDPTTRGDALAALARVSSPPTDRIMAALGDPRVDRRVAAALVLGRIDGPVLTRRLIEMVAADQNRREAFIALASSRGEAARAFVREAAQSPTLAGLARSTLAMNELQQTPTTN